MTFTVSPSQLTTAYLCLRKWGLTTIARAPRRQDIGAFRGESVHKILERYGKDGTAPETWQPSLTTELAAKYASELAEKEISAEDYAARIVALANKMIPLLPHETPWPGESETSFRFELDGVTWSGKIDYWHDNLVRDHKVVSSFDWARTDHDEVNEDDENLNLALDVQALVYAKALFVSADAGVIPPLDEVHLQWGYGQPGKTPRAKNVEVALDRAHVDRELAPHNNAAKELVRLRVLNPDPMTLEPTFTACEKMGGCPFQDRCKPTTDELADAFFPTAKENTDMGLVGNLKKKSDTTTTTTSEVAPKPKPGERTDDGNAKHDAEVMLKSMRALDLADDVILASLKKKFLGLDPSWLADIVTPPKPKEVAASGNGSAVNPTGSPEPKAETEKPAGRGRGKAATTAEPPPGFTKAIEAVLAACADETSAASIVDRAYAIKACAEVVKCILS